MFGTLSTSISTTKAWDVYHNIQFVIVAPCSCCCQRVVPNPPGYSVTVSVVEPNHNIRSVVKKWFHFRSAQNKLKVLHNIST